MPRIEILAIGRMKKGALRDLAEEYSKRVRWKLTIEEIESSHKDPIRQQAEEMEKLSKKTDLDAFVIVLDERGDGLRSLDFAETLQKLQNIGQSHLQFVIGGAEGLSDDLRFRANLLLSFGLQTWPHMLARVMLLEQIYRAQQILAGHPYHRDS